MINNPSYVNRCNKTSKSTFNNLERERGFRDKEDNELLALAKQGQSEAFSELYLRFAPPIFRFLFSHLDDRLDAEDLTEEVFLRLWRFLPQFQDQGVPILAFLFKIARNALIDFYRRSGRAGGHMSIEEHPIPALQFDPGESALASLEHQEVRQTLNQLREDYRMVLALRFLSGLTPEETGEVMGRTPGAVRILQHRALSALRNLLEI